MSEDANAQPMRPCVDATCTLRPCAVPGHRNPVGGGPVGPRAFQAAYFTELGMTAGAPHDVWHPDSLRLAPGAKPDPIAFLGVGRATQVRIFGDVPGLLLRSVGWGAGAPVVAPLNAPVAAYRVSDGTFLLTLPGAIPEGAVSLEFQNVSVRALGFRVAVAFSG